MKKQRVVRGIPVEEGSGNVYTDLGYPDSESMLVKAQLAAKIAEILQRRALTQARAAEILGLTQPKVSDLLKGRFRGISEHRLLECLTRLGRDVHIVIKPTPRSRTARRGARIGAMLHRTRQPLRELEDTTITWFSWYIGGLAILRSVRTANNGSSCLASAKSRVVVLCYACVPIEFYVYLSS
jgi:predicted XRE-type DNA-binding protein